MRAALPLVVLIACTPSTNSPPPAMGTVSIDVLAPTGFTGTTEAFTNTAGGGLVAVTPFSGHVDLPFVDGQVVSVHASSGQPELQSYFGLRTGGTLVVEIEGDEGPLHDVAVTLPPGSPTATATAELDGTTATGAAGGAVTMSLPTARPSMPALAIVSDQGQPDAYYGARALDTSSGAIAIDQPLAIASISITAPAIGGAITTGGAVIVGDDVLPLQSATSSIAMPIGFGDRTRVGATLTSDPVIVTFDETFDGDPPSLVDLTTGAAAPVLAFANFGTRQHGLNWSADQATVVSMSFLRPGSEWRVVAPGDWTFLPYLTLPDSMPISDWHKWGPLTALTSADTDYEGMLADPRWSLRAGTHDWATRSVPIGCPPC